MKDSSKDTLQSQSNRKFYIFLLQNELYHITNAIVPPSIVKRIKCKLLLVNFTLSVVNSFVFSSRKNIFVVLIIPRFLHPSGDQVVCVDRLGDLMCLKSMLSGCNRLVLTLVSHATEILHLVSPFRLAPFFGCRTNPKVCFIFCFGLSEAFVPYVVSACALCIQCILNGMVCLKIHIGPLSQK